MSFVSLSLPAPDNLRDIGDSREGPGNKTDQRDGVHTTHPYTRELSAHLYRWERRASDNNAPLGAPHSSGITPPGFGRELIGNHQPAATLLYEREHVPALHYNLLSSHRKPDGKKYVSTAQVPRQKNLTR